MSRTKPQWRTSRRRGSDAPRIPFRAGARVKGPLGVCRANRGPRPRPTEAGPPPNPSGRWSSAHRPVRRRALVGTLRPRQPANPTHERRRHHRALKPTRPDFGAVGGGAVAPEVGRDPFVRLNAGRCQIGPRTLDGDDERAKVSSSAAPKGGTGARAGFQRPAVGAVTSE
jgi:hypothetical protein